MALSTAGFQGPITEGQEAIRWSLSSVPLVRNTTSDLNVTPGSGRAVSVAPGRVLVCGVAVTSDSVATVTIPSSSTARRNVIAMRITWAGSSSKAELVCIQGPTGGTSYPSLTQTPGSVFEAPLAVVYTPAYFSSVSSSYVYATCPTGGRGGPLQLPASTHVAVVPAQTGATLQAGDGTTWIKTDTAWSQVTDSGSSWRYWDPVLRYEGAGNIQTGVVNLGNGGARRGRFKVYDRWLLGEVEIRRGPSGYYFGAGGLFFDLPPGFNPDSAFVDRWMDAHCYTTPEEVMDWHCQALIRSNESRARLWAPTFKGDVRMKPMQAADASGNTGTGVPLIGTATTCPDVITVSLLYSLGG